MKFNKWSLTIVTCLVSTVASSTVNAALFVEYYRDNLLLGLAYHRVGCLTDWSTIQSDQDYDGFADKRYCFEGSDASSVPGGTWYAWNYAESEGELDECGEQANDVYDTPDYARRSDSCNYNILFDCNSDCWIREFSSCQGASVGIRSPCW